MASRKDTKALCPVTLVRIDWQKVKAISLGAGNLPEDMAFFVIPVGGRDLLMSIIERLEWRASFRYNDYDYADWDYLQSIVSLTSSGLIGGVMLTDILVQLDRIADALEDTSEFADLVTAINSVSVTATATADANATGGGGCCGTTSQWRLPENWEDNHPATNPVDSETPTTETEASLCDMANSAHYEIGVFLSSFRDNVNAQNPYADAVADLDNFALGAGSAGWLYSIMTFIGDTLYDGFEVQVSDYWSSLHDDFVCSMVNMFDNAKDFKGWLLTTVRDNAPTWEVGYYIELLLTGTGFNIVYDGTYVPFPQFVGSDCSGCIPPLGAIEVAPTFWEVPVVQLQQSQSVNSPVSLTNVGDNEWELVCNPNTGYELWPDLSSFGFDYNFNSGLSRVGWRAEFISVSGGTMLFQSTSQTLNAGTIGGNTGEDFRGVIAAHESALSTWLSGSTGSTNYGSRQDQWVRHIQNGGSVSQTVRFKLWVLMKDDAMI